MTVVLVSHETLELREGLLELARRLGVHAGEVGQVAAPQVSADEPQVPHPVLLLDTDVHALLVVLGEEQQQRRHGRRLR